MTVLGADLPVAILISLAGITVVSAWVQWERHTSAVKRMAQWLSAKHPAEWSAQPWLARRVMVRSAIEALRRQGYSRDPQFVRLRDLAQFHYRRSVLLMVVGAAALGLVSVGASLWGWRLG